MKRGMLLLLFLTLEAFAQRDQESKRVTNADGAKGLDRIKKLAATNLFPPPGFSIERATPTERSERLTPFTAADIRRLSPMDAVFVLTSNPMVDTNLVWAGLKDQTTPVVGVVSEATATEIKVVVSEESSNVKIADCIVDMKKPLLNKEIPIKGFAFKMPPAMALIGTYDSFARPEVTDSSHSVAQIVFRDGELRPERKKIAPTHKRGVRLGSDSH